MNYFPDMHLLSLFIMKLNCYCEPILIFFFEEFDDNQWLLFLVTLYLLGVTCFLSKSYSLNTHRMLYHVFNRVIFT